MKTFKNLLFILSDQHHADLMSFRGHPQAKTPNLDRLAKTGVNFTRAYCQNPICTPSRMCWLSGQYAHNHGYYGLSGPAPANLPNLFGHLKGHGFRTAGIGKLHLPDTPRNWLEKDLDFFGECYRTVDGIPGKSIYFDALARKGLAHLEDSRLLPDAPPHALDARPSNLPFEDQVENWCVDEAIRFVEAEPSRPFFLEVSLPRPHHALTPDRRFWDAFPDDLDLPPNRDADPRGRPPHFRRKFREYHDHKWFRSPTDWERGARLAWKGYLACILQVDDAVGRLLDWLDRTGRADETLVVYSSDHGAYHGMHGLPEKAPGICSEDVCRIPFLVRAPGAQLAGSRCDSLVESIDLADTACQLLGVPAMATADGQSLAPLLLGGAGSRTAALTENPWSKSLRTARWRYVHYPAGMFQRDGRNPPPPRPGVDEGKDAVGSDHPFGELYDMVEDPGETRNLFDSPDHQGVVRAMQGLLLDRLITSTRVVTAHPVPAATMGDYHFPTAGDGKEDRSKSIAHRLDRNEDLYL